MRDDLLTDAHNPASNSSERETGYEQPAGDLDAEGEDGHDELEDERQHQQPDSAVHARARSRFLDSRVHVREVAVVITGGEEHSYSGAISEVAY